MSDGLPPPAVPIVRLLSVPAEHFKDACALAEPWLAASCERNPNDLTTDALREMVQVGHAGLFLIQRDGSDPVAAGVRQLRDYADGRRTCWILAVGGSDRDACLKVLPVIEHDARVKDCVTVEFAGRPGWAALLPDYACQAQYTKELR